MNKFKAFFNWLFNKHPFKKTRQNCPCYDKDGNFIGWFSRSVAIALFTFAKDKDGNLCVLASQRGKGTPDPEFVGAWNGCCGYLDWNETLEQACKRETFEETGIRISEDWALNMLYIDDVPEKDKRQNITIVYFTFLEQPTESYEMSHAHNETDEVDDIRFIPVSEISEYRWAFGHDKIIQKCVDRMNS